MAENRLGMVSEWMPNGNIKEFVMAHQDANRFELVGFPFEFLIPPVVVDHYATSAVGRRGEGLDPYPRSGNGSWGSQRGMSSIIWATLSL